MLEQRFWAKVDKNGPIYPELGTRCWLWTAAKQNKGYGVFLFEVKPKKKLKLSHRVAYILTIGVLADEIELDHRCHNHACCNPGHLRLATHKQNMENRKGAQRNSKSGIRGVSWDSSRERWRAAIIHNNKQVFCKRYETLEEATAAVVAKRAELFTHA